MALGMVSSIGLMAAAPEVALAQSAVVQRSFNLPAQPLKRSLVDLGRQAGVQVSADAALVEGVIGNAVTGTMSTGEAVSRLLSGTGLTFSINGSTVQLSRAPGRAEGAVQLGPVRVEGASDGGSAGSARPLAPIAAESPATTEGTRSYGARAATVLRGVEALKDVPQSVSIVSRQLLEDRAITDFDRLMLTAPGISRDSRNYGHHDYQSRGFSIASVQYDGVHLGSLQGIGTTIDPALVDRVEFIRGATGLLNGSGDPSGSINFVRKRPTKTLQAQFALIGGSWNNYRAEADISGGLTQDGSVRARVIGIYHDRQYYYGVTHDRQPAIYGVVEADLGPQTTITAGVRHQVQATDGRWVYGLPPVDPANPLPRNTSLAVDWARYKSTVTENFGELVHGFSDHVRLQATVNRAVVQRYDLVPSAFARSTAVPYPDLSTYEFGRTDYEDNRTQNIALDVNLLFDMPGLLKGARAFIGYNHFLSNTRYNAASISLDAPVPLDVRNPNHNPFPQPVLTPADILYYTDRSVSRGVYGKLNLDLTDALTVIVGGRLSWFRSDASYAQSSQQDGVFTPYVGFLYALGSRWNIYGSYTDIFTPQASNRDADRKPLDPAHGKNYEMGIKGELAGGRLNASAALFRILKTGIAEIDARYGNACPTAFASGGACYVNGGKVRSQGAEFELTGQLTDAWQISANYTYNETRILRERTATGMPSDQEGTASSAFTPKHIARIWSDYAFGGALSGVNLGFGASAQSRAYIPINWAAYAYSTPPRVILDASVRYALSPQLSLSANVNNLLDKTYFMAPGYDYGSWRYGDPRSIIVSLRGKF